MNGKMRSSVAVLTLLVSTAFGCDRTPEVKPDAPRVSPTPPPAAHSQGESAALASYRLPASSRIVAVGDLHGDLNALRQTFRLAGAIDSEDRWVGKDLTLVQCGDQLDRGDQDREVLDVLEKLELEAKAAGGTLLVLNGNHELMNASFDFRYVSRRGFAGFSDYSRQALGAAERLPDEQRGRAAAFTPGAPYALKLARHLTIAQVGDSLFAHGGVLPAHIDYGLDRINREASDFLAGKLRALPTALSAEDSPVWTRFYGQEIEPATCSVLTRVLAQVGAKRLIVGHTVQKGGINAACQDRLYRIDVGLSSFYGATTPAVLEISAQGTRILTPTEPKSTGAKQSQPRESRLHSQP
jgi:hypothetical protein